MIFESTKIGGVRVGCYEEGSEFGIHPSVRPVSRDWEGEEREEGHFIKR